MKLAVMQPYIFPYLGYFQLIHAADKFVFYDDVNFIKHGWVNRNRILVNHNPLFITFPLIKASQNNSINETRVLDDEKWRFKLLRTLELAYIKAPFYNDVVLILESVIEARDANIGALAMRSVKAVCEYVGLDREFLASSGRYGNEDMSRENRLIDICHKEGANDYVNAEGGVELYDKTSFAKCGVELTFLKSHARPYTQYSNEFVPHLSIIDALMFNSPDAVLNMIANDYREF